MMSDNITEHSLYADMTVLCVDDEIIILRTLQRLFHHKSYKIIVANSAKNALEILEKTAINIIVSDIRMPEIDGANLLEKVANSYPDTYRIVLSGYADFESTVKAINLGKINRFINKPWHNDDLINAVEEGLEIIRLKQENQNLKRKIEKKNTLLNGLNHDLEEKVNLRTKQIRASLTINERDNKAGERMLFNFIAISPNLNADFAKNVGQLAGRLAEKFNIDKEALHDIRLSGFLNEIGLLGFDSTLVCTPFNLLNFEQKKIFMTQGVIAQQILSPAQRLNGVKEILTYQFYSLEELKNKVNSKTLLACKILSVARDYWRFSGGKIDIKKLEHKQILLALNKSKGIKYSKEVLDILRANPELVDDHIDEKGLTTRQLLPKMILKNNLFSIHNLLILAEGHEFTEHSIDKIIEYEINQKHNFTVVIEQL
ncbi:MAG: response regulator RpfG family c-di-GMP phosphodiesterase [Colwellia sp.]|jgi:response regulator RpfG family c-di-GMP phosphodiesterase